MAAYRNSDEALMERVRRYIKGLGYYAKPPGGIPASDLAGWVLPSAVTDNAVGKLGYTKNEGTVTGAKVNNVIFDPDDDGTVDIGPVVTDVSDKADINSPTFTGTPKAPTPSVGTNNTEIATTAFVTTAVADAISSITGMEYSIVSSLPSTGEAGVIYLIANSGSSPNIYDEYIWVNNAFEKIGTTEIDLTNYVEKSSTTGLLKNDGTVDTNTYLTSYTETDPVFSASAAAGITSSDITAWDGKQDALSTQTAYTSKGSATKVPQITTNTLGQVTGITEVTITQPDVSNFISTSSTAGLVKNDGTIDTNTYLTSVPVTSVNGQTGAVTLSIPANTSDLNNDSGFITTYTETDPVFSASVAAGITAEDIADWDAKSTFSGSYNDLTDKPTLAAVATSGDYGDLSNTPTIPTVPTALSGFTDDLGSSPTHTHSQYLTEHQSLTNYVQKSQTAGLLKNDGTVDTTAYTTNTGTITSVKMNGSTIASSGEADLGTVVTDVSGKADKSEMSVSTSGDQTTITLKSGTAATVINQHQSLSGYVQTSSTVGLIKNDGTIDTNTYLTSAPVTSVNGQTGAVSLTIPSAPGTLNTTATTAQSTSSSEALSGSVTLHKVAKTGTYSDLIGTPTIPTVPSNIVTGSSQSYTIAVVSSMPGSPDANTIYLVTGS